MSSKRTAAVQRPLNSSVSVHGQIKEHQIEYCVSLYVCLSCGVGFHRCLWVGNVSYNAPKLYHPLSRTADGPDISGRTTAKGIMVHDFCFDPPQALLCSRPSDSPLHLRFVNRFAQPQELGSTSFCGPNDLRHPVESSNPLFIIGGSSRKCAL
jgi:hypothetical protein